MVFKLVMFEGIDPTTVSSSMSMYVSNNLFQTALWGNLLESRSLEANGEWDNSESIL